MNQNETLKVTSQLNQKQIKTLHKLFQNEWWTKGRTLEETEQCVYGSQICLAIVDSKNNLKAFTRVITDFTYKALVFDVIVDERFRHEGLGKELIILVKNHPDLCNVKHFELYCLPEVAPFYEKHEFSADVGDIQLMRYTNL